MAGAVQNPVSVARKTNMKNRTRHALLSGCIMAYCIGFSASFVHAAAPPFIQTNLKTPSSTVKIEQKS
jgi:hypothetical protein